MILSLVGPVSWLYADTAEMYPSFHKSQRSPFEKESIVYKYRTSIPRTRNYLESSNLSEIYPGNSNSPLTRTVVRFPSESESEEEHATILKGIGGSSWVHCSSTKRSCVVRMFGALKEKQGKYFRQLQCQEQCTDHIPYYSSGLLRAHLVSDLSRNSWKMQCNVRHLLE